MRAASLRRTSVLLAGVAVATLAAVAAVSGATASPAKIVSVTFTGSEANPTITIRGHGLGQRPRPNPAYHPLGHPPLCPPEPTKPPAAYGFDYGTSLFIEDRSAQPLWSAGRYRPQVNELDCIGLVMSRFSATVVVLRLGAFYREQGFHLAEGDVFRVSVNGSSVRGRVHYR